MLFTADNIADQVRASLPDKNSQEGRGPLSQQIAAYGRFVQEVQRLCKDDYEMAVHVGILLGFPWHDTVSHLRDLVRSQCNYLIELMQRDAADIDKKATLHELMLLLRSTMHRTEQYCGIHLYTLNTGCSVPANWSDWVMRYIPAPGIRYFLLTEDFYVPGAAERACREDNAWLALQVLAAIAHKPALQVTVSATRLEQCRSLAEKARINIH